MKSKKKHNKSKLIKLFMIYGFAYLMMVLAISAGWIILAVLKKPDFIENPLNEVKNKIRPFLNPKDDQRNHFIDLLHMRH